MSYVVFNIAHHKAHIHADGPSLRLLGRFSSQESALEHSKKFPNIETRIFPVSKYSGPGLPPEFHWRPITNVNISSMTDSEAYAHLETEYASVDQRVKDWIDWRTTISKEVYDAAKEHVLRPVETCRAENILHELHDTSIEMNTQASKTVETSTLTSNFVPSIAKDLEIRDQDYMILCIMGDARYEREKELVLKELGTKYFSLCRDIVPEGTNLTNDRVEAAVYASEELQAQMRLRLQPFVDHAQHQLDALIQEPMVAFFDTNFKEEPLEEKIVKYAEHGDFFHYDLAIVRMYQWLRLDKGLSIKNVKHVARNEEARSFFEAMRKAQLE